MSAIAGASEYKERLAKLAGHDDAWQPGDPPKPEPEELESTAMVCEHMASGAFQPLPYLYLDPDGGILMEWGVGKVIVSLRATKKDLDLSMVCGQEIARGAAPAVGQLLSAIVVAMTVVREAREKSVPS